ncbi:MAG: type II toxin-antitoxin system antitoxin SocA domain-containing protein [Henriciella sp.]|uniref:Panacea domain-containing protein n=1 Tax=Henriciella sp. TaxID=1968823 RepID=UPI003C769066
MMAYDIRAIANYVLDFCEARSRNLSNIEVIKICYFVHEHYLVSTGCRITDAKVEAWGFGPVFRELYSEFRKYGRDEIRGRAQRYCFRTQEQVPAYDTFSQVDREIIEIAVNRVFDLSYGQLIELSHIPGGPWDRVYNHKSPTKCGMEITDEAILGWYQTVTTH